MRRSIEWMIAAATAAMAGVLIQAPALAGQPAAQPAYRTTITPITPDRWTKPLPPLPERQNINADGKPLAAGPIQTDAKVFSVTVDPDGAVAHWLVEATTLNVDGKNAFHAAHRKTEHNLAP